MKQALLFTALAFTAAACGGASNEPAPAASAAQSAATGYFTVPAEQMSHLQVVTVAATDWATTLHTTGTVDWDNDHTTQAIPQVNGPITRIVVDTGTRVKEGDPLLFVASADIANAVSTYRKAKNRFDQANRTLARNKDLLDHKAIAQRDYDDSESDFNDASTDLQTALQSLKILGVTEDNLKEAETQNISIRAELPMRSPIAGMVVQKLVYPGEYIQAGATTAFVVSDVSTVWVQAHLYEKDLKTIHVGDGADIRATSLPDTFHGTVAYIDHLLDPATRTTLVRIVTANPSGLLKKDLFVDVTMHDRTTRHVLTVPTTSVLYDDQNFPFVYVDMGQGRFAQKIVSLGIQQGDATEVVSGLAAGDRVVSQGSLFLQFASSIGK